MHRRTKTYYGLDVHSYTSALRDRSKEFSEFWRRPFSSESAASLLEDIRQAFDDKLGPGAHRMLDQLSETPNLYDPELDLFVVPILFDCRKAVIANPESAQLFCEILEEINTTCVQGDTHRLLSFYFSLQ